MIKTFWGLFWGLVSAVALPLGCAFGLLKDPGTKVCAFLMAFGAGSLLFALTLELFGEAIHEAEISQADIMAVMVPSAILGGLLFISVNHIINRWGSFLRNISTKTHYLAGLPASIRDKLQTSRLHTEQEWSRLLSHEDYIPDYSDSAPGDGQSSVRSFHSDDSTKNIGKRQVLDIDDSALPSDSQPHVLKAHSHNQVGIAIWLGILIDGIPESLIIGILAASKEGISLAFIMGVFLSNFPEALSSTIEMQKQGMPRTRIFLMWSSLCILTGIGSMFGAAVFPREANKPRELILLNLGIEGVAAGAMLTVIAQTMLPEAFSQGGDLSGIAALLGFLTTMLVKLLGESYI